MNVAILFSASWCGPCKQLKKAFDIGGEDQEKYVLPVDIDTNLDIPMQFNVRSVPTIVILNDDVEEVKRFNGFSFDTVAEVRNLLKDNPKEIDLKALKEKLESKIPVLESLFQIDEEETVK